MAGIYFHIPFCKRICGYCDFYKSVRTALAEPVLGRMHEELEARSGFLHDRRIRTIYFGGGTPSLCPPGRLGELAAHAGVLFDCTAVEECTAEVNPDDVTPQLAEGLLEAGFDRLSVGIQSFDDGALRFMNRRHTAAAALNAVRTVRTAGFRNISVDVIFGIPGFGGDALRRTLDGVLALEAEHVSAYHLTLEPQTAFGRRAARGTLHAVDERTSEREFLAVHDTLTQAGYEHYEVSNFARAGFRARHNAAYWSGEEYLGIGPSAHSYDGMHRRWSTDTVESYAAGGPFRFEEETLTQRDRYNEFVMTRLRTSGGIDLGEAERLFGAAGRKRLERGAAPYIASGILHMEGDFLRPEPRRFLVSDTVIGTLFE